MPKKSRATTTATGFSVLASTYYSKQVLENLKAQTPFMRWGWACACGSPQTHTVGTEMYLCDGCFFRWTVMNAAGRGDEFRNDYDTKHQARLADVSSDGGVIDILKRRPLPVSSGKMIQMFQYDLVAKP